MGFSLIYIDSWASSKTKIKPERAKKIIRQILLDDLKNAHLSATYKGDFIKFKGDIFRFIWNGFDKYNPVSNGYFYIYNIDNFLIIKYKLYFWEFFIWAVLFSSIVLFGLFPNIYWRIGYLILVWTVYLINILIASHRISNFIKRQISAFK